MVASGIISNYVIWHEPWWTAYSCGYRQRSLQLPICSWSMRQLNCKLMVWDDTAAFTNGTTVKFAHKGNQQMSGARTSWHCMSAVKNISHNFRVLQYIPQHIREYSVCWCASNHPCEKGLSSQWRLRNVWRADRHELNVVRKDPESFSVSGLSKLLQISDQSPLTIASLQILELRMTCFHNPNVLQAAR